MDYSTQPHLENYPASQWDGLFNTDYPFIQHRFLSLLEHTGCTGEQQGWLPQHLGIEDDNQLIAVLPLYLKTHSLGEYVFDWSWAEAYHRNDIHYFPKLVCSIPFTPAIGPRIGGINDGKSTSDTEVISLIYRALNDLCHQLSSSSWHLLFPNPALAAALAEQGAMLRHGVQFIWNNHGYTQFDDFLAAFNSRKRKNLQKERRAIVEQNLEVKRLTGEEISTDWWHFFYGVYENTYLKKNGTSGYLTDSFFQQLGSTMTDQVMMVTATHNQQKVAAALFFYDSHTLYGRYWGCIEEYACLHFELCYYQGIEFAIEKQLRRFDAGAQGDHKLVRGFEPCKTYSAHWIKHPQFADAIKQFLAQEQSHVDAYFKECEGRLPFRADFLLT